MDIFLQCMINGIAIGAVYASLALSYTILYGTLGVANYAQGDIFMIGMVLGFTFFITFSMSFVIALILSVVVTIIVLLTIERSIYRSIYKVSPLYLFIASIGMATFLRSVTQLVFGSEGYSFPPLLGSAPVKLIGNIAIQPQSLIIIAACIIMFAGLKLFMSKTKVGLAMSAVSMNKFSASLMGINLGRITTLTYSISAGIAAITAILSAPVYNVSANIGASFGFKALIAAIMGGFGNATGALVGGLILGLIETLGSLYISTAYKDAFAYIVLIAVLLFRPQGFFGRKRISKV